jgi:hypothetical protein
VEAIVEKDILLEIVGKHQSETEPNCYHPGFTK